VEPPSQRRIDLDGSLSEDLRSGRVTLPQTNQDAEMSEALKHLIRQVRSVKFEEKTPRPTFTPPEESQSPTDTGMSRPAGMETQNPASSPAAPMTAVAAAPAAATTLPAGAQKTLSMLRQNPTQVRDPLEMAELLFLSGQAGEAAPFYARALQNISRDDPNYDADRAWILFQLGNCLRESDIAKAQEVYMKLVSEYPASPWTELAKAHGRLLTWYHKDRPEQLTTSPRL
jgi:tetratricopeptide (TPR) repeat protein